MGGFLKKSRGSLVACLLATAVLCDAQESETKRLEAGRVAQAPAIDGRGDDSAWAEAKPLVLIANPAEGSEEAVEVTVSAVSAGQEIYLKVSWPDETQDASHKTWVWNKDLGQYEEGPDREDVVAVSFAHTGPFTGDMFTAHDTTWDVWQWKSFRTNPSGYAMDKTHRYWSEEPQEKSKSFETPDGGMIWIGRAEDAGASVESKIPKPESNQGDRVPQFEPGTPDGSAADIQARGEWAAGRWTVEFSRKLDTGYADDSPLVPGTPIGMGIAVFDHSEHINHRVTEVFELVVSE